MVDDVGTIALLLLAGFQANGEFADAESNEVLRHRPDNRCNDRHNPGGVMDPGETKGTPQVLNRFAQYYVPSKLPAAASRANAADASRTSKLIRSAAGSSRLRAAAWP